MLIHNNTHFSMSKIGSLLDYIHKDDEVDTIYKGKEYNYRVSCYGTPVNVRLVHHIDYVEYFIDEITDKTV